MADTFTRLDSWKEIAEYLGRDVRTAMRWAKSHGLPVRRVAGGRGRSVFAFAHELDAWLAGRDQPQPAVVPPAPAVAEIPPLPSELALSAPAARGASTRSRLILFGTAAALVVVATAATLISLASARTLAAPDLRVAATPDSVTLTDSTGAERTIFRVDPGTFAPLHAAAPPLIATLEAGGGPAILVAVPYSQDRLTKQPKSGELLRLDRAGRIAWRAPANHSLRYRNETFNGAFVIADWQLSPESGGSRRAAVATHEWMWWPAPIAVLEHDGRRSQPFVNPGWMESLRWLDDRYLLAGGFNNHRDAAVVTLLDTTAMNGQAPGTEGTAYECLSCGTDKPVFYATLPRTELNRVTGSRFNRAQLEINGDRIVVTTIEIPAEAEPATAIYEFSRDMKLLRARYSEAYWDWHRKLEAEGRIKHSRAACPQKHGPPHIDVWDASKHTFVSHLQ